MKLGLVRLYVFTLQPCTSTGQLGFAQSLCRWAVCMELCSSFMYLAAQSEPFPPKSVATCMGEVMLPTAEQRDLNEEYEIYQAGDNHWSSQPTQQRQNTATSAH